MKRVALGKVYFIFEGLVLSWQKGLLLWDIWIMDYIWKKNVMVVYFGERKERMMGGYIWDGKYQKCLNFGECLGRVSYSSYFYS